MAFPNNVTMVADMWNSSVATVTVSDLMNTSVAMVTDKQNITCGVPSLSENCALFLFYMCSVTFSIIIIIGLTGNTLTVVTLFEDSKTIVSSLMLVTLACCDSLVLVYELFFKVVTLTCVYLECHYNKYAFPYLVKYVRPFGEAMIYASVWLIVLLTIHRTIAVVRPHKANQYLTITSVRIQCATVIVVALLVTIPRYLQVDIIYKSPNCPPIFQPSKFGDQKIYQILYNNIFLNIFVNIGPLIIVAVLSAVLVKEIRKSVKRNKLLRRKISESDKCGTQITIILIIIVVAFLIFYIPRAVFFVAALLYHDRYDDVFACGKPWFYFLHVVDMLIIMNASVNFFIYCLAGAKFRTMLRAKFCGRFASPKRGQSVKTTAMRTLV